MPKKLLLSTGEVMIEFSQGTRKCWTMGIAGDTFNTAWYARALLERSDWSVAYFTRLGEDQYSAQMIATMAANGIDTQFVQRDPARRPGLYLISVNDGERSFSYWRQSSAARLMADDEQAMSLAMANADAIYLSGITLAILEPDRRDFIIDRFAAATRRGKLTAFDPNIRPALWDREETMRETLMAAAAASAVLLPSFSDERTAFGDKTPEATGARYRAAGCKEVIVKNGSAPSFLSWGDDTLLVPTKPIARPIDTTGAGDAFNGAYLAARLNSKEPVEAAMEGHRVARIVVGRHGAIIPQSEVTVAKRQLQKIPRSQTQ